jgi:hypothetical protein
VASYKVQLWSTSTTDFSTDALVAEFEYPMNLGYGTYLNDIGEAFFTVSQYDVKANVRSHEGKGHIVIIRDDGTNQDVVWRGILAEHDANGRDVVFYCYSYEHLLFSLYTKWNEKWRNQKIAGASGRPINDLWARAIAITDSPLQWVGTGTLQAPTNTTGGTSEITLNRYRTNWKRILSAMRELVAISASDTSNITYLEIDYGKLESDLSATFNFWKDNTSDATDIRLEWGENVMDFNDRYTPVMFKNKTLAVGTGPRNQLYRFVHTVKGNTFGRNTFGMRMQNMYLSWVRDRKELKRVVKRRTRLALREDTNVWVRCFPDSLVPWRATGSSHELGDRVYTDIVHGVTSIQKWLHMMGEQVVWVNGREYVQPMLEERTGSQAAYTGFTWIGPTSTTIWKLGGTSGVTAAATANQSVAIPDDTRVVLMPWVQDNEKTTSYVTGVTLNGVAGTNAVSQAGDGTYDRFTQIFSWYAPNVPAGETVTLAVTHSEIADEHINGYGLAVSSADLELPVQIATGVSATSESVTIDAGLVPGMGVVAIAHDSGIYSALSGSTILLNAQLLNTHYMSVTYEDVEAAGNRTLGEESLNTPSSGGATHSAVGIMVSNDET